MNDNKQFSSDIIILGLGPGNPDLITRRAWDVIKSANEIFLRTDQHPTVNGFPSTIRIHSFDDYYQVEDSYEVVYQRITDKIISLGQKTPGVIYAVPGDPFVAESTTPMILSHLQQALYRSLLSEFLVFPIGYSSTHI